MKILILLLFAGSAVMSAPTKEECPRILREAEISDEFASMVAHTIHSLTLEDIRYYFKSDATEENGIPTVNYDLDAEKRVLPNAPLIGYDEDFLTMSLRTFDLVMRHMNRTDWSTRSPFLVNLVHSYHMQELWVKTAEQYKIIEQLVDPKSDTCACLTDIENNAVLYNLHMIAFCLRYPGLSPENVKAVKRSTFIYTYGSYAYHRSYEVETHEISERVDFEKSDMELLEDVAQLMTTDRDSTSPPPALDGVEHWPYWKEKVKGIDFGKSGFYDIALFIFCTLN